MPRKHHKPEEIVAKLRQVDVLTSQGKSVADAIRAIGVTEATYSDRRAGRMQRLGGFDPETRLGEDVDFFGHAMREFGACFLDRGCCTTASAAHP